MPKAKKTMDNSRSLELVYEMPGSSDFGIVNRFPKVIPMMSAIRILLNADGVKVPINMAAKPMMKLNPMPFKFV